MTAMKPAPRHALAALLLASSCAGPNLWTDGTSVSTGTTSRGRMRRPSRLPLSGPGFTVQRSLLVVDGITIDNDGAPMNPCVEARCDADYVYIASNGLMHYDFVQTTPNPLVEKLILYRVPRAPQAYAKDPGGAESAAAIDGCADGYAQYLDDANQAIEIGRAHV